MPYPFLILLVFLIELHPENLVSPCLSKKKSGSASPTRVRVVQDPKLFDSKTGVPIELWYNETYQSSPTFQSSSPGCPQSIEGVPWVYYGKKPSCFLAGNKGPCQEGSLLLAETNSSDGVCGCMCLVDLEIEAKDKIESDQYIHCKKVPDDYPPGSHHGQIYDKKKHTCLNVYSQGPCASNKVVAGVTNNKLLCSPLCSKMGLLPITGGSNQTSCVPDSSIGALSGISFVSRYECSASQRFSTTLKKCVSKFAGILGVG